MKKEQIANILVMGIIGLVVVRTGAEISPTAGHPFFYIMMPIIFMYFGWQITTCTDKDWKRLKRWFGVRK